MFFLCTVCQLMIRTDEFQLVYMRAHFACILGVVLREV